MNNATKADSLDLASYASVLRRRWWVVLALVCFGLLVAGSVVAFAPRTYTATASVYVRALPTDSRVAGAVGAVDMDNEVQLVQSPAVAQIAAKHLNPSPAPHKLMNDVTATVPANTTVLNIACQERKAESASACANAVAAAYLSARLADTVRTFKGELAALHARARASVADVAKLTEKLRSTPTSLLTTKIASQLEVKAATAQLNAVVSRTNYLTAQLTGLEAPDSTLAGHVLKLAAPPGSPSSPKKTLLFASGLLGGLLMGLITALWLEVRDERLHDARDVERIDDVPMVLDLRAGRRGTDSDLAAPGSQASEGFVELAEYVATTPSEGSLVLLVAGASPEAGISVVAANLSAALAEARPEVALVCAPQATLAPELLGVEHRRGLLGVEHRRGLAELLAGEATVAEVGQTPAGLRNLQVIGPGRRPPNAALRRDYHTRRSVMAMLRSHAQYVVVESPLPRWGSPLFTLAEFGDAAIVVVEASRTKRSELDGWLGHLARTRVPVLGAVMVSNLDRIRPHSGLTRISRRRAATAEPSHDARNLGAHGRDSRAAGDSVTASLSR